MSWSNDASRFLALDEDARTNLQHSNWAKEKTVDDWLERASDEIEEARKETDLEKKAHELGDVLWCLLTAIIASENAGGPELAQVLNTVDVKIRRRKPHIFGFPIKELSGAEEQIVWLEQKAKERNP